jgi:hypothetical protein
MVVLAVLALVGLAAALFLPPNPEQGGGAAKVIPPDALDTATSMDS